MLLAVIRDVTGWEELRAALEAKNRVLEERQNFDPSGHYSRPDVTRLLLNRERQSVLQFTKKEGTEEWKDPDNMKN